MSAPHVLPLALLALHVTTFPVHATENPSWDSRILSDGLRLRSRESMLLLAGGGLLAGLSATFEDPGRQEDLLEDSAFDGVGDFGNVYGSAAFLGPAALGLLGAGALTGSSGISDLGRDVASSLLWSQSIVGVLKVGVGRTRPNGDRWSFPSGHTASAFAVAPVLGKHLGWRVGALAYAMGVGVAAGRMEDRFHYLSDVVFGASIGLAVGRAVSREDAPAGAAGGTAPAPVRVSVSARGVALEFPFPGGR